MCKTPCEIEKEITCFLHWLASLGYAKRSVETYRKLLINFFRYLNGSTPTQAAIERFNTYLHNRPISRSYIMNHLKTITLYSKYLEKTKQEKLVVGHLPVHKSLVLQRIVFSKEEITGLYNATEDTPKGLWDRALLGLHYGCGLRSHEGINLLPEDIDYHRGLLYVRPSKNHYDRYIPVSKQVLNDFKAYAQYARGLINNESPYFLVGMLKDSTNGAYQNKRLKILMSQSSNLSVAKQKGTLHCLRHSIATHLLAEGMDIASISKFLGHRSLKTTQEYVRVTHTTI